jgi:hypothetical protein
MEMEEQMDEQMHVAPVIAAEVEPVNAPSNSTHDARFNDLERRVRELEAAIADMRTVSAQASVTAGRKTAVSAAMAASAKGESVQDRTAVLDATLGSLSVEQRIAVKSGMIRAGLL